MNRFPILAMILVALVSMAPGFGRPALEIQIDRTIAQYEESMDPLSMYEWMRSELASERGWDQVAVRTDGTLFKKLDQGVTAFRQSEHMYWMRDEADGASFMAAFHTRGPVQGGTLKVRADGAQIHASLYADGSVLWAFVHPDGRVLRRKVNPDGTVDYSAAPSSKN